MHATTLDQPVDHGPAIVIPGALLLVPELVGAPGDPEADRLRAAVLSAGRWLGALAGTWRVVGAGPLTWPDGPGTFAGFGADVAVSLAGSAPSTDAPSTDAPQADAAGPGPGAASAWPVPLLIAAWLRGASAPSARIAGPREPAEGTVFVLDGPNTLSERAPGGYRPEDAAIFRAQVAAVCEGGPPAGLDPAWAAAAHAFAGGPVDTLYRGAPFGVGYLVATGGAR